MDAQEFDPYYETKVDRTWGTVRAGFLIGYLLIILGILSIIFSIVDLANGNSNINGSAWQENSIWPTIGKGIWVGVLILVTGIMALVSLNEHTRVSLYIFNTLCWLTMVFALFMVLSCILHIEPYNIFGFNTVALRTDSQNVEVVLNSMLIGTGCLSLIAALFGAILSCIAAKCCLDRRRPYITAANYIPVYQ